MMTSHRRLLEVSSRLWDRTQRSCVIRIVIVGSAGFSSHGVRTTVDTSDQMLLTPGCTCLWGTTVQCDEGTCWLTYSAWTGYVVVLEANGGRRAWCWRCGRISACRWQVVLLHLILTEVYPCGLHRRHRGLCCASCSISSMSSNVVVWLFHEELQSDWANWVGVDYFAMRFLSSVISGSAVRTLEVETLHGGRLWCPLADWMTDWLIKLMDGLTY